MRIDLRSQLWGAAAAAHLQKESHWLLYSTVPEIYADIRFPSCCPRIPSPKVPTLPFFLLALLARKLFHHDIEAIHHIV